MKIAVVGSGIAGHGAALALAHSGMDVTLFEKDDRAGGHANTLEVNYGGHPISVDTGFIVYNEENYPNLTALLAWAGVETRASDMSFALSIDEGAFEWCGRHDKPLSGLFAQKRNLFSPGYLLFLREILAFQKVARASVAAGGLRDEPLATYLARNGFSRRLQDDYIVPMGAAIWSMTPEETLLFPVAAFLTFFDNHKLLQWDRPRWRTVVGGSRTYVRALGNYLGSRLRLGCGIAAVERNAVGVTLTDTQGHTHAFDAVILATSAPATLAMLRGAWAPERAALAMCRVSDNLAVLHCDPALMPRRKGAWAAWNLIKDSETGKACVTYWMNRLQGIPEEQPLFVTLNPVRAPASGTVFAEIRYQHPVFDAPALAAQKHLPGLQGAGNIWFAGAWTGYGFHEDGLRSGLAAARALGAHPPWHKEGL